jgi:hypothetical protein
MHHNPFLRDATQHTSLWAYKLLQQALIVTRILTCAFSLIIITAPLSLAELLAKVLVLKLTLAEPAAAMTPDWPALLPTKEQLLHTACARERQQCNRGS